MENRNRFDFIKNSKIFFGISIVLIAVVLVSAFAIGPQLDIQFRGGSIITFAYDGDLDIPAFKGRVQALTVQDVSFQESTDIATGTKTIVVSMPGSQSLNADQMVTLMQALDTEFAANNPRALSISNVDATIGREFLAKCLTAVVFASALMIIFVAFRFRKIGGLSAGVMAVVALMHDIVVVFGVFILFGMPINDNFIAVVLTILGYSLNDTIVIYDRVRENKRLLGAKTTVGELVNTSINQSFVRSINTTITTVLAMVVVTVVAYLYNVDSILSFSFPMILGLVSGAYSSICIAGPLWVRWQQHKLAAAS